MPNVVTTLTAHDHKELKKRAKLNRRTLGSQLAFEAFSSLGLTPPTYLNEDSCEGIANRRKQKGGAK